MQYKTIVLELLQQQTELHEELRLTRRLLPTMEALAKDLKAIYSRIAAFCLSSVKCEVTSASTPPGFKASIDLAKK